MTANKKYYWWRTIVSFLMVLFTMPLGHALMLVMDHTMTPTAVHYGAFLMGLIGMTMVIIGVFAKGDTKQTLWGFLGGLLFWTGWVEFLFQYYAERYGVQPEVENGVVVTRPEYLILPATFGFWAMIMLMYLFSTRNGCNFINWFQKLFFGSRKNEIAAHPMTRHTSIVTFMELNMILWTCYLALMFCYDKRFLGDHHPVTFIVAIGCLIGSVFMFKKELRLQAWGANIRMAIATVIVFWTPVEVMGRINLLNEIWVKPEKYRMQIGIILVVFLVLLGYLWFVSYHKHKKNQPEKQK
ncbi:hypothetical protein NG821_00790 [Prevotella cerevisiae]|uniref:Uncharacterized protein n=1 Tax=Segatella cerevisiae TaxID=2053716 RepID=A0ABT1BTU9_9BACT|nr:hypothetical protein [Segatella cerevisiae]MCO6024394.1 hypothetical protein [Segatella cerevisiae]